MPLHSRPADIPRPSETTSPAPVATPPHPQWTCGAAWWNERDCEDIWWPGREGERNSYHQPSYHHLPSLPSPLPSFLPGDQEERENDWNEGGRETVTIILPSSFHLLSLPLSLPLNFYRSSVEKISSFI